MVKWYTIARNPFVEYPPLGGMFHSLCLCGLAHLICPLMGRLDDDMDARQGELNIYMMHVTIDWLVTSPPQLCPYSG